MFASFFVRFRTYRLSVLGLEYDGAECFGIVHRQIGKNFPVDFDACFVERTHEFRVGEAFETGGSVDTLNPQGAEIAFFRFPVAVSIGQTFFPSVFGNSPDIFTGTDVTACKFQNFFSSCS